MKRRPAILTLLGFAASLWKAEGEPADSKGKPHVDPVRAASELLRDTQGVLQELTDLLLIELNGIPALKAAGLHFERRQEGSGSRWAPRLAGGIESGLFTCIDVRRRRHPTSFVHLDLNEADGSIKLTCHAMWLPAETIVHPLWESDGFAPSMFMKRKPAIQP